MEIFDKESNELKARIFTTLFIRGIGGFCNKGFFKNDIPAEQKGKPQHEVELKTEPNLAVLYRLNGDMNPLHIDP